MNNLDQVLTEIETDLSWREEELRFFERPIRMKQDFDEDEALIEAKPLILMLYAHFEGHAKLMLSSYVGYLNNQNLSCVNVSYPLIASSLHSEFGALKNPDKKHRWFPKEHDPGFKELGRRIEFLESMQQIFNQPTLLNNDKIVDTESNLKPKVLKKIFFRLGFDIQIVNEQDFSSVEKLLQWRNNIAHGSQKEGFSISQYSELKESVLQILRQIKDTISDYIIHEKYLKGVMITP